MAPSLRAFSAPHTTAGRLIIGQGEHAIALRHEVVNEFHLIAGPSVVTTASGAERTTPVGGLNMSMCLCG